MSIKSLTKENPYVLYAHKLNICGKQEGGNNNNSNGDGLYRGFKSMAERERTYQQKRETYVKTYTKYQNSQYGNLDEIKIKDIFHFDKSDDIYPRNYRVRMSYSGNYISKISGTIDFYITLDSHIIESSKVTQSVEENKYYVINYSFVLLVDKFTNLKFYENKVIDLKKMEIVIEEI